MQSDSSTIPSIPDCSPEVTYLTVIRVSLQGIFHTSTSRCKNQGDVMGGGGGVGGRGAYITKILTVPLVSFTLPKDPP